MAIPTKGNTRNFLRGAILSLLVSTAFVLITLGWSKLHLNVAIASLLFVVVIVVTARVGNLVSSTVTSVVATLCLLYGAPPNHTLAVDDPLDVVAIVTFGITSLVITSLVSRLRTMAEEARASVNRKLLEAEERERTRIGRELHDDICQRLALLVVRLQSLKRRLPSGAIELESQFDDARKQAVEIADDLQALSHRLHTSKVDLLGLAGAARSLCREFADQQNVEIDFHSENVPKALRPDVSVCMLRVLQEALQNATKHSASRHFDVSLTSDTNEVKLKVLDSGIGFEPEEAINGDGLGLTSMRERLKLVDGQLCVESQPQKGTTIQACVPLAGAKSAAATV